MFSSLLPCALLVACGGGAPQATPPAAVDLLRQAAAASEIVDPAGLARHTEGVLAAPEPARYLAAELRRIGLAPGSARGGWVQPFEDRQRIARSAGPWVLERGAAKATLGRSDLVAALGVRSGGVRLRGLPVLFAAPTLAAAPGRLASTVVAVLDPLPGPVPATAGTSAGAPAPLADLLRRAAAARVHAVLVLPRPGAASPLPSPARAAELAAGSGVLVVAWLDETAARALVHVGLDVSLEAMARLEWRADILPLALGTLHAEVVAEVAREPHRNVVALLPGRGASDEAVAVLAELPGARARRPPGAEVEPRARAAAAAELLAVATGFQALSDAPRRTVVFAFTDPGDDGLAGARQLLADPRWPPSRMAAALVLARGNLGQPTRDVTFVGARASPLFGPAARLAALQGRRVGDDPASSRGQIWHSPAWAMIQAGVPTALLAPGWLPRPGPAALDASGMVAVAAAADAQPYAGLVEDARLAFRLALELAEGGRPPRVDPARVEAVLRQSVAAVPVAAVPVQPRPRRAAVAVSPGVEGAVGSPAPAGGGSEAAGAAALSPLPANAPEFAAPPPEAAAPAQVAPSSPEPPRAVAPPPAAAPTATPPQRRS